MGNKTSAPEEVQQPTPQSSAGQDVVIPVADEAEIRRENAHHLAVKREFDAVAERAMALIMPDSDEEQPHAHAHTHTKPSTRKHRHRHRHTHSKRKQRAVVEEIVSETHHRTQLKGGAKNAGSDDDDDDDDEEKNETEEEPDSELDELAGSSDDSEAEREKQRREARMKTQQSKESKLNRQGGSTRSNKAKSAAAAFLGDDYDSSAGRTRATRPEDEDTGYDVVDEHRLETEEPIDIDALRKETFNIHKELEKKDSVAAQQPKAEKGSLRLYPVSLEQADDFTALLTPFQPPKHPNLDFLIKSNRLMDRYMRISMYSILIFVHRVQRDEFRLVRPSTKKRSKNFTLRQMMHYLQHLPLEFRMAYILRVERILNSQGMSLQMDPKTNIEPGPLAKAFMPIFEPTVKKCNCFGSCQEYTDPNPWAPRFCPCWSPEKRRCSELCSCSQLCELRQHSSAFESFLGMHGVEDDDEKEEAEAQAVPAN